MAFAIFVCLVFLAATSGGAFRPGEWYRGLAKPPWQPPGWLFGPVWAVLYAMIATAGWLVWEAGSGAALILAMTAWGVQLALNAAWSGVFFGLRRVRSALLTMIAMWLAILATIAAFLPISTTAALLLLPYLVWVSFAGAVNAAILRRNPAYAL